LRKTRVKCAAGGSGDFLDMIVDTVDQKLQYLLRDDP
jgi:hypothetical protein